MTAPPTANGLCRALSQASRQRLRWRSASWRIAASLRGAVVVPIDLRVLSVPDAGIEDRVQDVDHEIGDEDDRRTDDRRAHQDREVVSAQSLDDQLPHAGDAEDLLDEDGAGQEVGGDE